MSRVRHDYRQHPRLALAGMGNDGLSEQQLGQMLHERLDSGIHGICFSPYMEGQGPGTPITAAQISSRLAIIKDSVSWIRTFSCTEGNELIPQLAHEQGLSTLVGAWLDGDLDNNELEIENIIAVGAAGHANIIAVGNEVLLRGELSEDQLIDYIQRVKKAVPGIPVGYVDAYYKFVDHQAVTQACDVVLANCYPFWEACAAEYSLLYMKDMYRRAMQAAAGKRVIITETGWPNIGSAFGGAVPSAESALRYFLNTYQWAQEENIDIFYFSAFDEAWKVADEGDVGAYWGIWDKDGNPKYSAG